jgi:hypothetical protein
MKIGIRDRSVIDRIGPGLANEIEGITAGIVAGWNAEHKTDGQHGAITCDSIQETGRGYPAAAGMWTKIPYDATRFYGEGAMTWTVASPPTGQRAYKWSIIGETMDFKLTITDSTIAGVADNTLFVRLPDGFRAVGEFQHGTYYYVDGGGFGVGLWELQEDDAVLRLYKDPSATVWVAGANICEVFLSGIFHVRRFAQAA